MRWRIAAVVGILAGGLALYRGLPWPRGEASAARAQAAPAQKAPGLRLCFRSLVKGWAGQPDCRTARLVAIHVPAGETPSPFLPPGPFEAVWTGELGLRLGSDYTFTVAGRGRVKIEVNGEVVLEAEGDDLAKAPGKVAELRKRNALRVEYQSPAAGDAALRVLWGSPELFPEPLPPTSLRHDTGDAGLEAGRQLRLGRELVTSLRCLKCHEADTARWVKAGGMPELEMDTPSLSGIGARLNEAWLARWIQDPHALRPTARMPRVLGDAAAGLSAPLDGRARDMAAYLASLEGGKKPDLAPADEEAGRAGAQLFGELGCVGCHTPPEVEGQGRDAHGRTPLRDVAAKWQPDALRDFLVQPDRHFAWIRMPNFQLSAQEADRLASYLEKAPVRDVFRAALPPADVERGRALVASSGCLSCHVLKEEKSTLTAPNLAVLQKGDWERGCMASDAGARGKAPVFPLEEGERQALKRLCREEAESLGRRSALEMAARLPEALRCIACHVRDTEEDVWSRVERMARGGDDEEDPSKMQNKLPRPSLTWAGEKLKPEWVAAFVAGKVAYKPRPYLKSRMPAYPRWADTLARALASEHGCPPTSPPPEKPSPELVEVGRHLASNRGWNCVGCHGVGKTTATTVFEAPGPNFMYLEERIRRDYFDRWLWSPNRVEPGTKMPIVYMYGQPSQLRTVLDGDAARQIDAMWHYFLTGYAIKPPPTGDGGK